MKPVKANIFVGLIEHQFLGWYNGLKPKLYVATLKYISVLPQFITAVNSLSKIYRGNFRHVFAFLEIKVLIKADG